MKIVVDNKIPYIRGVFEPVARVCYCSGAEITPGLVKDADALVIRTRTKCDKALLHGSAVRFIATASIGHDHIDKSYCQSHSILWQNAPGCNANSVQQYVAAALVKLAKTMNFLLSQKTLGVIGVGHTGSKVARMAERLGMRVLLNDPPRERIEGNRQFVSLAEIQKRADIISLHVPLSQTGIDKTYGLINTDFIARCQKKIGLINTSRGPVLDSNAIQHALRRNHFSAAVLDVWENEPHIDRRLMDLCLIATPHIAGYAYDGKLAGTRASVRGVSRFFHLGLDAWEGQPLPEPPGIMISLGVPNGTEEHVLYQAIEATYDIMEDDTRLRKSPETFEEQRENYPSRREIAAFSIRIPHAELSLKRRFEQLGFTVHSIKECSPPPLKD